MAKIGRPLSRASKALECESRFERHVGVSGSVREHVCVGDDAVLFCLDFHCWAVYMCTVGLLFIEYTN